MEGTVDLEAVEGIVAAHGRDQSSIVPILLAVQEAYGYIPEQALTRVSHLTGIRPSSLTGVATFYSQLRLRPAGRHSIKVCVGTACHVMGAGQVLEAFRKELGIQDGSDTDADRLFSVSAVACLGCCMLAPAVQIDDVVYGPVQPDGVPGLIEDFLATREAGLEAAPVSSAAEAVLEARLCWCSSCTAAGAGKVRDELQSRAGRQGLPVRVRQVACTGQAYLSPLLELFGTDGRRYRYGRVDAESVAGILEAHLGSRSMPARARSWLDRVLDRLAFGEAEEPVDRLAVSLETGSDAAFVLPQSSIATAGAGVLDPLDLDGYRKDGGMTALELCRGGLTPDEIIARLDKAGLRGRGGAGFPAARKWAAARAAYGRERFVICNGDEGDPGAFMDRMLLESFPFRVLEGLLIAALAVGARRGFLYIRAEYPLALERVRRALELLTSAGWLAGAGDGQTVQLEVVPGAGAFVCGEETALIAAIEGRRGIPRRRPPYPVERGLWGCPTLVNNVETLALVPGIVGGDPTRFASLGTTSSRGSKCFALAGKVVRSGLIEVPMGTSLRSIVDEIGGGVPDGRALKAIQIGGPSGGCVPARLAETPVDYEALTRLGAMMGSGGLVVLDSSDCIVDVARYFMRFIQEESCGRCTFCRVGTRRMLEILDRLCEGRGRADDIERLAELGQAVRDLSQCGLGRTAANPVLSTLEHFRDEYLAHIEHRCPAGRCRDLVSYVIRPECTGCTRCAQRCSAAAIQARPYEQHAIDQERCTRCGTCLRVCPVGAVEIE